MPAYRCRECDVFGFGPTCWACASEDLELDARAFAPPGSQHYNPAKIFDDGITESETIY